jgi:hypothetical protein
MCQALFVVRNEELQVRQNEDESLVDVVTAFGPLPQPDVEYEQGYVRVRDYLVSSRFE